MSGGISASTVAAVVSIAATAASTAMAVMSQQQQAQAAQAQAGYQSAVMRNNQAAADMMAADARARGEIAEAKQREKTKQILGTQTAALAGQGTDLSGSALDILGDSAASGEFDALTVRSNAAREAWGHEARASQLAAESMKPVSGLGGLGVGASLIGGAGSVADKWYRFFPPKGA
jgi:hypothetical protein